MKRRNKNDEQILTKIENVGYNFSTNIINFLIFLLISFSLIGLKLFNVIQISWFWVLLPIISYSFIFILIIILLVIILIINYLKDPDILD